MIILMIFLAITTITLNNLTNETTINTTNYGPGVNKAINITREEAIRELEDGTIRVIDPITG